MRISWSRSRKLIRKGRLKQGDQLPAEKDLSETFKVSRLTVREAILSLETMKLVDRRQGNGTYVIASSEEALVKPLAAGLVEEKDNLLDVFAARGIIEPEIAQLAANNATPEQVAELERILEVQEREVGEGRRGWTPIFTAPWQGCRRTRCLRGSFSPS